MVKDDLVSAQPNCLEPQSVTASTKSVGILRGSKFVAIGGEMLDTDGLARSSRDSIGDEAGPRREYHARKSLSGLISLSLASAMCQPQHDKKPMPPAGKVPLGLRFE